MLEIAVCKTTLLTPQSVPVQKLGKEPRVRASRNYPIVGILMSCITGSLLLRGIRGLDFRLSSILRSYQYLTSVVVICVGPARY